MTEKKDIQYTDIEYMATEEYKIRLEQSILIEKAKKLLERTNTLKEDSNE